jgi:hypothetical protein
MADDATFDHNILHAVPRWWHVFAAVAASLIFAGASTANTQALSTRVDTIDQHGTAYGREASIDTHERLARIEQSQIDEDKKLDHIMAQVEQFTEETHKSFSK